MESGLKQEVKPWPLFGYAPGGYMAKCIICDETFDGDKRAFNCLPCAASQAKRLLTRAPSDAALVEALEDVTAHLAAAISLLSRSPKTGAASNKMFDQMLIDYDNSAARGRAALAAVKGQQP